MKKTKFITDALTLLKAPDLPLYAAPKSLQETIEIKNVYPDGIFELNDGKWSKSYIFEDVNYSTCDENDQETVFIQYCKFLNSMDANYKITINNKYKDMDKFRDDVLLSKRGDGLDMYRNDMNNVIEEKLREGTQGIEQERYLTVTVERKNYEEAEVYFRNLEVNLGQAFRVMGSDLISLDGNERLHILYDFYHSGRERETGLGTRPYYQMEEGDFLSGGDFRDDLCNGMIKFSQDFFQDENKFCRAMFIKKYPNSMSDRFLNEIMSVPEHIITSIDVVPIPKDVTVNVLKKKQIGVDSDIVKQQKARMKNNDFSSDISYTKRMEKKELESIMDDVRENDKCLFYVGVTFLLTADTKQALDALTETVETIGKRNSCVIDKHYLMQREALNSALPIGVRQVRTMRTLLTDALAALLPFNVQELSEKNGVFYGINQISKNLCVGNRKKLINGNGFIFGVPGSGKSFFAKTEMANVILGTNDDVIVVDPMNEYMGVAANLGGESVVFSNYSENYINPMEIDLDKLDMQDKGGIVRDKGEFMLGLCEQCMGRPLEARQKSIIDRCVRTVYFNLAEKVHNARMKGLDIEEIVQPTMTDFCQVLSEQPERDAEDILLALEIFTTGSLNFFNHQTNVDTKNRFVVYGIRDLGHELSKVTMLVMMESISRRILKNAEQGRATWVYVDEVHVLLDSEYSARYLFGLWKKVRKQGGLCTGLTQNVVDLLRNYTAVTMLANSEFVVLLKQASTDAAKLSEAMGISQAHLGYVTESDAGKGLLKHGRVVVPFDMTVDRESRMYEMFNTNPHEK